MSSTLAAGSFGDVWVVHLHGLIILAIDLFRMIILEGVKELFCLVWKCNNMLERYINEQSKHLHACLCDTVDYRKENAKSEYKSANRHYEQYQNSSAFLICPLLYFLNVI